MTKRLTILLGLTLWVGILSAWSVQPGLLQSAVLARGYAHERAVGVTTRFHPTDNPLHCVVQLHALPAATALRVVWIAVHAGGKQNYEIAETTLALQAGDAVVDARLSLPRPWPVGTYKVALVLKGKTLRILPFFVR